MISSRCGIDKPHSRLRGRNKLLVSGRKVLRRRCEREVRAGLRGDNKN